MFTAIACFVLGSVLIAAANQADLVDRQNEFIAATYIAEAGQERIYAAINKHMKDTGQAPNQTHIDTFSTGEVPNGNDHAKFDKYIFITPEGHQNKIKSLKSGSSTIQTLTSGPYAGLYALITPYQVVSRTRHNNKHVWAAIQCDVQIQHIPIFQFAIFYNMDMEIENGPVMSVNGRVHGNANGYFAPGSSLTFQDRVTLVQNLYHNPKPGDTHQTSWITPTYNTDPITHTSTLNMPIATTDYHDLIELPPAHGNDPIATDRLYNKAGLRIQVTNSGISATDASGNTVTLSSSLISTNRSLYNYREGCTVKITELDIGAMLSAGVLPANGILYVADTRTSGQTAVRLVNGAVLPSQGLTIVSQNPVYIKGNYNTTYDQPAAIFADSINILSGNWSDSCSSQSLNNRMASGTTVNSAFFTGIVPTTGSYYSGGVENLPRFLENWTGQVFAYRGSMVVMFPSETATGRWVYGGNYYTAPTRNWAFDTQFLDATRLPPGTPSVRAIRRANWKFAHY
jgi:hypothetical protein